MEEEDDPLLSKALVHLCVCESFNVFGIPEELTRVSTVEYRAFHRGTFHPCTNPRCQSLQACTSECGEVRMATWLPKHRVPVVIYTDECRRTYLGIHGRVLFASESMMLGHCMPKRTMVLAHFTEDSTDKGKEPRVLVYDIVILQGEAVTHMDPHQRYKMLLPMFKDVKGLVSLQWVGHESSATKSFDWFKQKIPHEVECLVNLGHNPWVLCRVMHVQMPQFASREGMWNGR